ncbi:hypothetical protein [Polaromonas glacialis]|uniref:hypothetical protein n=1 Tax=Polaromonas glacialis TaxID=866564 RepID=UPI0012EC6DE3|nr:hypothetical protein [Polaromonas glacialis]
MKEMRLRVMGQVMAFLKGATRARAGSVRWFWVANGLRLQRTREQLAMAAMLAVGAVAGVPPAEAADGANAQVAVGATVLRHAGIHMLTAPRTVSISQADIARGYVDVAIPSTLEIRSNSPTGYLLAIESQADFARGTEVRGNGGVASLDRFGGMLSIQTVGHGMKTTPVELRFRILLSQQARPGVYPWAPQIWVLPV